MVFFIFLAKPLHKPRGVNLFHQHFLPLFLLLQLSLRSEVCSILPLVGGHQGLRSVKFRFQLFQGHAGNLLINGSLLPLLWVIVNCLVLVLVLALVLLQVFIENFEPEHVLFFFVAHQDVSVWDNADVIGFESLQKLIHPHHPLVLRSFCEQVELFALLGGNRLLEGHIGSLVVHAFE